jgi:hypothetical protein
VATLVYDVEVAVASPYGRGRVHGPEPPAQQTVQLPLEARGGDRQRVGPAVRHGVVAEDDCARRLHAC